MKNVPTVDSRSLVQDERVPWFTFIFLAAVFFASKNHDVFASLQARTRFDPGSAFVQRAISEGSLQRRVAFSMLGLFGIVGLLRRGQNLLGINGVLGWIILLFFLWSSLSITWADDAALTFRRLMVLWMFCLGAAALGKHFSPRDIILWVFWSTGIYLLIGIGCELVLGTFRPLEPGYRFAGTLHPNVQATNCLLLLVTGIAAGRAATQGRWFFLLCAFGGLVFLVLTRSRTALGTGFAALLVYWALVLSRSRLVALLLGISIGACLLLLLVGGDISSGSRQGALLGRRDSRDSSLNGRIPLWKECLVYARRRPLQGYGYDSFFTPSREAEIATIQGWGLGSSHSAYLELILNTGIVGMISFVLMMVVGIKRAVERYKVSLSPFHACFIAILVFTVLHGVLESNVVLANMLSFVVMVLLVNLGFGISEARASRTVEVES